MAQAVHTQQGRSDREFAPSPALPYDARFRTLIGSDAWAALPHAVQRRFSKRLAGDSVALYRGSLVATHLSRVGWCLAQLCRLIGAPLPLGRDAGVAAVVSVSEDKTTGGQCWTRIYARRRGFPQVIHSAKRFAGQTGLEEYVGSGVGMALSVTADTTGISFTSAGYFLAIGRRRLRLPRWLTPGVTVVRHRDLGNGRFAFDLSVTHRLFGVLVAQHAVFDDV